jgi:hypothetical protein
MTMAANSSAITGMVIDHSQRMEKSQPTSCDRKPGAATTLKLDLQDIFNPHTRPVHRTDTMIPLYQHPGRIRRSFNGNSSLGWRDIFDERPPIGDCKAKDRDYADTTPGL